jgi:hypothetical protein
VGLLSQFSLPITTANSLTILAKEQMNFGRVFAIPLVSLATVLRVALVCQKLDAVKPARKMLGEENERVFIHLNQTKIRTS